jgi:hypothetical protein
VVTRETRAVSVYLPYSLPIAAFGTTAAEDTAPVPRDIRMCIWPPEIQTVLCGW